MTSSTRLARVVGLGAVKYADLLPNRQSDYVFSWDKNGLAGEFTAFYENCPVLKAEPEPRASRLLLCDLTARVLKQGLEVLGIEVLEQM